MTIITLPDLWPDQTTADLLVTDRQPAQVHPLACGCTRDHDCAHAAHLRARPALALKLIAHRAPLNRSYAAYQALQDARALAAALEAR